MEIRQSSIARTGPLSTASSSGPLPPAESALPDLQAAPAQSGSTGGVSVSTGIEGLVSASALEPLVTTNLQALADMETLRKAGKLTPAVMAGLEQLATQPLAAGVNRAELVGTALRQLADPSAVDQGDKFTCAPAVVQMMVADEDPGEYLRLVSGLASPEGQVTLQNGATISRDANWQADATRSVVDNLMQPALMQYATGSYDSLADARQTANGTGQGLYAGEQDKLIAAVTGRQGTSILGNGPEVLGQLAKATAAGQGVPAIIKYQDENGAIKGHAVLVESVANGKVTYLDPKAGRKTVSLEEFQGKLQSVSLATEFVTPTLAKSAMKEDEGLLAGGFMRRLRRAVRRVTSGIKKAVKKVVKAVVDVHKQAFDVMKKTFFKVVDTIAPVLPVLSVAAWLIPGVGPAVAMGLKIAQGAVAAANAYRAIKSGDILGGIAAGASAFSGVMSGPATGAVAKFASYAGTARQVVSAVKTGDFGAAVGAIAGAAGNQDLATVGQVASAVQRKDLGAALNAVGGLTDNQAASRALSLANTALQAKQAVESKDFLGAAMMMNGMAVDAKVLDAKQGQDVQRWLERGQAVDQARRTGDMGSLMNLTAQTAEELGVVSRKEYKQVLPQLQQGLALYQAAKKGDVAAATQLGAKVLAGNGVLDPKTAAKAQALGQQAGLLKQAIDAKDFGNVAKAAARMGFEAGVVGLQDPAAMKKVADMADRAARLQEGVAAARRGDIKRAAKIADEIVTDGKIQDAVEEAEARIHRELEERRQEFEAQAKALGKQAMQKVKG